MRERGYGGGTSELNVAKVRPIRVKSLCALTLEEFETLAWKKASLRVMKAGVEQCTRLYDT